jgi:hypothetical protein
VPHAAALLVQAQLELVSAVSLLLVVTLLLLQQHHLLLLPLQRQRAQRQQSYAMRQLVSPHMHRAS